MTNEFDIIAKYFKPLAVNVAGAFGLENDGAVISPSSGCELVITKDAMTEGVHFFKGDNPYDLARKILRVNLSDLAAMGAVPKGYLLVVVVPKTTEESWIAEFARGLADDNAQFKVALIGGDTVSHAGPLTLSITAFGDVAIGKSLQRNGAKEGDIIYVTGTVGDSTLGLRILQNALNIDSVSDRQYLTGCYYLPEPRTNIGPLLVPYASAALDISDGLVQDLQHILTYSSVGALLETSKLPLSEVTQNLLAERPHLLQPILTGGDDYELLFTAPPHYQPHIATIAEQTGVPITAIGVVKGPKRLVIYDRKGKQMSLAKPYGYQHF